MEFTWGSELVPVPRIPHFKDDVEDELKCLNLNIVLPPAAQTKSLPVMVWIHGGSLLFGSSTNPCYDMVKLVDHSTSIGAPIIGVTINYRVGLFGFLASSAIADDLNADGLAGAGNFGLTDQQTALHWVNRYIASVGGDPENVTIFGESAGGMSVAHQIWAREPAPFARAISMSGTINTIPVWSLEEHERRFRALLRHLNIEGVDEAALAKLRSVPKEAIAKATCEIEGTMGATGNPCNDGWYHSYRPSLGQGGIISPPEWLKGYMIGDVKDEAAMFRGTLHDQTYESILGHFSAFLGEKDAADVLQRYGISADLSHEELDLRFEKMATEGLFWIQTYLHAHASKVERTYAYHFDQVSQLETSFKGLAHHAVELVFVFQTLEERMTDEEMKLSRKLGADFIQFAHGNDPWRRFEQGNWMVYGPDNNWAVKSEEEDKAVRNYVRMLGILQDGLFPKWAEALDYVIDRRWHLGAVVPKKDT
ncbi:hypothetical protein KVR01_000795 [Diaporthe batatas]|uniref:uncharacterized protein n=1 Tax=Diaporthe batatas TaxID=748121 RepID=UPI001D050604|nr:uncharacterized protein KVR01_000795 [Diaporthe batatas]KAG8170050.1 hypothetical protein KVR01_000795 [Diaporthe batatas]